MDKTMSRAGRALRQNAVAFLALFVALGSTGALAATIAKNSVGTKQIRNGQVRTADLGRNSVNSARITDGTVAGADVGDGALTGADLGDNTLTGADIEESSLQGLDPGANSVESDQVTDGSLTGSDIAANSLTGADIDESSLAGVPEVVASGYLTGPGPIQPNTCTSVLIPNDAIVFGDSAIITPPQNIPNGASVTGFVTAGNVGYKVCNEGEAQFPNGSGDYRYLVLRP